MATAETEAIVREASRLADSLLPWDVGPVSAVLRGDCVLNPFDPTDVWSNAVFRGPIPPIPADTPAILPATIEDDREPVRGGWQVSHRCRIPADEPDDQLRMARLAQWEQLAKLIGDKCRLGRQIQESGDDIVAIQNVVANTFAPKATNTLGRRATSVALFLRWAASRGMPASEAMPPTEALIYDYVEDLRVTKAPATRAQSFVESIGFAAALLGLDLCGC